MRKLLILLTIIVIAQSVFAATSTGTVYTTDATSGGAPTLGIQTGGGGIHTLAVQTSG